MVSRDSVIRSKVSAPSFPTRVETRKVENFASERNGIDIEMKKDGETLSSTSLAKINEKIFYGADADGDDTDDNIYDDARDNNVDNIVDFKDDYTNEDDALAHPYSNGSKKTNYSYKHVDTGNDGIHNSDLIIGSNGNLNCP